MSIIIIGGDHEGNRKRLKRDSEFGQMLDWFDRRTHHHIRLVQKYCGKIDKYDPEKYNGIVERGKEHDKSKFEDPEMDPYVMISWRYKCKKDKKDFADFFDSDEDLKKTEEEMNKASEHHIKNNAHHPEFHTDQKSNLINKDDRDKPPAKMIDATKMGDLDIAEMCADWTAMSEELADDPIKWADKNVNVRWKFTDEQKDLIYELIKAIW